MAVAARREARIAGIDGITPRRDVVNVAGVQAIANPTKSVTLQAVSDRSMVLIGEIVAAGTARLEAIDSQRAAPLADKARLEDLPVPLAEEILRPEQVGDVHHPPRADQQRPQHRLLRLVVVRWDPARVDLVLHVH